MSTGSIAGAAVCQVQPAQEQRIDKRTGDGHDNISGSRMSWSGESYRNKTIMQRRSTAMLESFRLGISVLDYS